MRQPMFDPTAGDTAREIRAHPGASQHVPDPTDPHCGELFEAGEQESDARRNSDPTDPGYGELAGLSGRVLRQRNTTRWSSKEVE